MATSPLFIARNRDQITTILPEFGTSPRVIYTPDPVNGSQISGINIASTSATAKVAQLGLARILTKQADMGTGNFVDNGGAADTISRTVGSFIDDGWRQGMRLMAQNAQSIGNDFEETLTAVAAAQLTLAIGGGTINTAEELTAETFLAELVRSWPIAVPENSGTGAIASVTGLDPARAPFLDSAPDRRLELGPNDLLVASIDAVLLTGETVDITVLGADY